MCGAIKIPSPPLVYKLFYNKFLLDICSPSAVQSETENLVIIYSVRSVHNSFNMNSNLMSLE